MSIVAMWRSNSARYRLETVRCAQCGALHFPARLNCPTLRHPALQVNQRPMMQGKLSQSTVLNQESALMP